MEYEISISKTCNHIIIRFYAPMTTALACRCGPELVHLASENNIDRFLFDVRHATNIQSHANNFFFANKDIMSFGFPRASRSAFLVRPGDTSHDFITTAFLNAGYSVKLFSDEEEAVTWLERGSDG